MAKSIKLGSDTYLAAAGVDGIKGAITSGDDLDNYVGVHNSGFWYIAASHTAIANAPLGSGYSAMIVAGYGSEVTFQFIFKRGHCWSRDRTGNPAAWSQWMEYVGTYVS